MAGARAEENLLPFVTFPLLVLPCALFLFFRAFFGAALFAALIVMIFLAMYYARRPRITHRPARFLRAVFFTSFTYPGDRRQPRLSLRLSVIVVVSVLMGLLLGSRRVFVSTRHDRPAEASTVESSANP